MTTWRRQIGLFRRLWCKFCDAGVRVLVPVVFGVVTIGMCFWPVLLRLHRLCHMRVRRACGRVDGEVGALNKLGYPAGGADSRRTLLLLLAKIQIRLWRH